MGKSYVTPEEIAAVRGQTTSDFLTNQIASGEQSTPVATRPSKNDANYYISKLINNPKNPIAVCFTGGSNGKMGSNPLGYIEHSYENYLGEDMICVNLRDYFVFFNDYTRYVVKKPEHSASSQAIKKFINNTGEIITHNWLFGTKIDHMFMANFPESYAEAKKKFNENNLEVEKNILPEELQKFFKDEIQLLSVQNRDIYYEHKYGTADPEEIMTKLK